MVDPEIPVSVTLHYKALGGKSCAVPAAPLKEPSELDIQMNRSRFASRPLKLSLYVDF